MRTSLICPIKTCSVTWGGGGGPVKGISLTLAKKIELKVDWMKTTKRLISFINNINQTKKLKIYSSFRSRQNYDVLRKISTLIVLIITITTYSFTRGRHNQTINFVSLKRTIIVHRSVDSIIRCRHV